MLEVLVAILILSIGLLGIAGLLGASLRYAQGGWSRAAVSSSLSDIADRVRSNPGATTTAYLLNSNYATQRSDVATGLPAPSPDCSAATCTAAQLAAYDLLAWRVALDANLPGAAGYITGSRDTGYQATIVWADKSNLKDDNSALRDTSTCPAAAADFFALPTIAQRTCCPAGVSAPAGARCTNLTIVP